VGDLTPERLAPEYGYRTREASAKPWSEVPEQNRALMTATCVDVLAAIRPHVAAEALREAASWAEPSPPEVSWFGDDGPQVGAWLRLQAHEIEKEAGRG
jgi:hypothetical protein